MNTPNKPDSADMTWLTPQQAASALGVTPRTVQRWADDNRIRSKRPGNHRRYLAADVEALAS